MKKKKHAKKNPFRVIIKFNESLDVPYTNVENYLLTKAKFPLAKIQRSFPGIMLSRLYVSVGPNEFGTLMNEIEYEAQIEKSRYKFKDPKFQNYFSLDCPADLNQNALLNKLSRSKCIKAAYIDWPERAPSAPAIKNPLLKKQNYLDAAPIGIDAQAAWKMPGGDGTGTVQFVDIESAWDQHPDLPPINVVSGLNKGEFRHGTQVLGVILSQDNKIGGKGITPSANFKLVSITMEDKRTSLKYGYADRILYAAANLLQRGDIMLIEGEYTINYLGPTLVPVETNLATFEAIKTAAKKGIIVIEPAANNGSDLDFYKHVDKPGTNKKLIFKRGAHNQFRDSGAIMVGGATSKFPHSNKFNYGSRIDCYAWGQNITTTSSRNGYTNSFDGTSGASAIIAGAVIAIQSMYEAKTGKRLGSHAMRSLLRNKSLGTSSANPKKDKIRCMPDLKKIVAYINKLA